MGWERPFTLFGVSFVLIGIALILVPIIIRLVPGVGLEKIPWFLLYVYQKDGFFFATSPILILIGIIHFLLKLFHQ